MLVCEVLHLPIGFAAGGGRWQTHHRRRVHQGRAQGGATEAGERHKRCPLAWLPCLVWRVGWVAGGFVGLWCGWMAGAFLLAGLVEHVVGS